MTQPYVATIKGPLRSRQTQPSLPARITNNWASMERLRFIEARLFWVGRLNRSDIVERFGIHESVASQDLTDYQAAAPRNAVYDRQRKTYWPGKHFLPLFGAPCLDDFVGRALLQPAVPVAGFEFVRPPLRRADPLVVRNLIFAARERLAIRILYRSMTTPEGRERWIEPHTLVSDGFRWHVRAYCREHDEFRDFVVGRIVETQNTMPSDANPAEDSDWHSLMDVEIGPHSMLTDAQAALVRMEYGMAEGGLRFAFRKALLPYLLIMLRLDEDRKPPAQLLELKSCNAAS